jgi:ribonuclease P protein component
MIARSLRLRSPADFQRVRRRGRSWTTPYLVLVAQPNNLDHNRYGFAVGRRVGKAVCRNRVKRWMREAIRKQHPHLRQGNDVILIARGKMAENDVGYDTVEESVGILVKRSGLAASEVASADEADDRTSGERSK